MKVVTPMAAALLIVLSACDAHEGSYTTIPAEGWAYGDTVAYVPADTVASRGTLEIIVRHDDDYPYANLWLELTTRQRGDSVARVDTLDVRLADTYGHWQGRGIGGSYQYVTPPRQVKVSPGTVFNLRHIMRVDTLCHIQQIGMRYAPQR